MSEKNKNSPSLALQIYKDLGQMAFQHLGKYLDEAVRRRLDTNLSKAADKLRLENPENIALPKLDVAVPILEKMRYIEEDALVEAYAELLKSSCLKDRQSKVLPAYVDILSRLTSDEIKILDFLYREKNTYEIPARDWMKVAGGEDKRRLVDKGVLAEDQILFTIPGIPFLEVRSHAQKEDEGWIDKDKYFTDISKKVDLSSPKNLEVYIGNLQASGVFEVRANSCFAPASVYDEMENEATRQYKGAIEEEGRRMKLVRGEIRLTSLAISFLAMCTSSGHNEDSNASAS